MTTLSPEFIKAREDFATWYDNKPEEIQALIDEISDRTYNIIDEEQYDEFIEELSDYGITTAEDFEDRFYGEYEGSEDSVGAEIAETLCDGCYTCGDLPSFIINHIDWEAVWNQELRYDHSIFEFGNHTYVFTV